MLSSSQRGGALRGRSFVFDGPHATLRRFQTFLLPCGAACPWRQRQPLPQPQETRRHVHHLSTAALAMKQPAIAPPPTRLAHDDAATEAAPPEHAAWVGDDEWERLFWAQPLHVRLAAVTVARFMQEGLGEGGAAHAGAPAPMGAQPLPPFCVPDGNDDRHAAAFGAMPMRLFVERIPAATRDVIFHSRRDAVAYIRQSASALLEMVYQHGDGSISLRERHGVGEAAAAAVDGAQRDGVQTASASTAPPSPEFGSVPIVRVRGGEKAAAAILRLVDGARTRQDGTEAAAPHTSLSASASGGGDGAGACGEEGEKGERGLTAVQVDAILTTLVSALRKKEERSHTRYSAINEAYLAFMREAARFPADATLDWLAHHLTREQFSELLLPASSPPPPSSSPRDQDTAEQVRAAVWVLHERYVAVRRPDVDGDTPPRFTSPQPRVKLAGAENNFGGWGGADAVPTKEDVYEILKYIPVNWGNLGNVSIPPAIKKKHLRSSSPLQWFRRQPYYFEVRNMNGTTEIRRSCVLHPEAHGLTPAEARERLELAIASGEANDLTPLGPDGQPLAAEMSGVEKAIHKFFARVCPPYFAPLSLVMQRYTKKNLTESVLLEMARRRPSEFEVLQTRFVDVPLVRKRVGADSQRWREAFVADLEKHPEDVRGIVMIMNRLCPSWDRPEYVYVRLTPEEQRAMGGFDAMMTILRRHPAIFRVGENFVSRVDSSDPFAAQEAEPDVHDLTSRTYLREENPYLSPIDLALVFHYAASAEEPCTATFLVDCASPAMRVALPPRVVTIVQQFPRLFACKETAPGVFSIRKIVSHQRPGSAVLGDGGGDERGNGLGTTTSTTATAAAAAAPAQPGAAASGADDADEDDSWRELEAEMAEEEQLTKPQLLAAVLELIPRSGVEGAQLLLWASMPVQRAASHFYGGLLKMVDAEKAHFRVEDSQESKMVFRREEQPPPPPSHS